MVLSHRLRAAGILAVLLVLVACTPGAVQPEQQREDASQVAASEPIATATPAPPTATPTPAPPTATPTPAPPTATPTPSGPLAPDLEGATGWINTEPFMLADLRGQVILVNFWTFGCYNCQNTMPYVREWWDTYEDQGLVIVGVHTPELEWERPLENVQQAVLDEGIGWPVVQDNNKTIWRAYRNRYWPRFYLVDHNGRIIYDHIGEGAYENTEQRIVEALEAAQEARS
jgi:thiol-disulfide isomerase/thioredoxin